MSFYFCNNLTFCLVSFALKFMALSKHDVMQMCILEGIKLWCEDHISDLDRDDQESPKKRQRVRPSKINYGETNWGRILSNPRVKDPESREGKLFRLRFRCPFALFEEVLMPFVVEKDIFPQKCPTFTRVPTEIKVLIALRILGRGNFVDDVSEMSSVARSSVLDIFKQFVRRFSKHNMEFIRFHQEERLKTSMSVYSNLGRDCLGIW